MYVVEPSDFTLLHTLTDIEGRVLLTATKFCSNIELILLISEKTVSKIELFSFERHTGYKCFRFIEAGEVDMCSGSAIVNNEC